MDRVLKVYCNAGYTFANVEFSYEKRNRALAKYTTYRVSYISEDEETKEKTIHTYEEWTRDMYPVFRKFNSIQDMKAHDVEIIKQNLGRDMTDPAGYSFVYETEPVQRRYFIGMDHANEKMGVANISIDIEKNIKELRFFSAKGFKWDFETTSDCLETNMDLLSRIMLWDRWGTQIDVQNYDLHKVDTW